MIKKLAKIKYLQKKFVKNLIFQQLNLEFLKIKMMQKNI
jgi:hypothetical protein